MLPGIYENFYLAAAEVHETASKDGTKYLQLIFKNDDDQTFIQSYFEPKRQDEMSDEAYEKLTSNVCAQILSVVRIYTPLKDMEINTQQDPNYSFVEFIEQVANTLNAEVAITKVLVDFVTLFGKPVNGKQYLSFPGGINGGFKSYFKLHSDTNTRLLEASDFLQYDRSMGLPF